MAARRKAKKAKRTRRKSTPVKRKAKKVSKLAKVSHMTGLIRRSSSGKRQMTEEQEFEIMKLVLDKFLWLGFLVMGFGMYLSLSTGDLRAGGWYLLAGAGLLLLFLWVIVKEFEILEKR